MADAEVAPLVAVLRAMVPLAQLLGYAQYLCALTEGNAREVIWFSHYSPIEAPGQNVPPPAAIEMRQ